MIFVACILALVRYALLQGIVTLKRLERSQKNATSDLAVGKAIPAAAAESDSAALGMSRGKSMLRTARRRTSSQHAQQLDPASETPPSSPMSLSTPRADSASSDHGVRALVEEVSQARRAAKLSRSLDALAADARALQEQEEHEAHDKALLTWRRYFLRVWGFLSCQSCCDAAGGAVKEPSARAGSASRSRRLVRPTEVAGRRRRSLLQWAEQSGFVLWFLGYEPERDSPELRRAQRAYYHLQIIRSELKGNLERLDEV